MKQPIHVISFGAGVQSSTLALMASREMLDAMPMPAAAIFADTKAEPKSVYDWLEYIQPLLKFPVITVSAGSLTKNALEMHVTHDGRKFSRTDIPFFTLNPDRSQGKIRQRGCTRDFKIYPIIKRLRKMVGRKAMNEWRAKHKVALKALTAYRKALADYNRTHKLKPDPETGFILTADRNVPQFPADAWNECQSDPLVVQWIGISADEAGRMKMSRDPWIKHVWPLVEGNITRADCLEWMEKNGYPKPPRSACIYCPFHDDNEWRRLRDTEPREFKRAVKFEAALQKLKQNQEIKVTKSIPFLHKSCIPIGQIDFDAKPHDSGQQNLQFENECEGMCGV